jgi:hypothetical protein
MYSKPQLIRHGTLLFVHVAVYVSINDLTGNAKGVTIDSHESDGGVGIIHCHCCYATGISALL